MTKPGRHDASWVIEQLLRKDRVAEEIVPGAGSVAGKGMNDRVLPRLATLIATAVICASQVAQAQWPQPAQRSGGYIPTPGTAAVSLEASGAYVPEVGTARESTGTLEGGLVWNFAVAKWLGFFGRHTLTGMWWGENVLRAFGHEVGLRYGPVEALTLEAAYLGHRVDSAWVDGKETRPGGVLDNGGEVGMWLHVLSWRRVKLEPHLLGRVFKLYNDTHWVPGGGLRLSLLPAAGHALVLSVHLLSNIRMEPRAAVEKVTWNTIGQVSWRSLLVGSFGVQAAVMLSTNLLVGRVPMLELKRSMIDEPMGLATVGVFFEI